MEFLKYQADSAPAVLQAMTMVASAANHGLGLPQQATLDAMQRLVLETDLDVTALTPITPAQLAPRLNDPSLARQSVRLMVTITVADGPPSAEQITLVSAFAKALDVRESAVAVVGRLARHRLLMFRLTFARHSHVRTYFRNTYRLLGGVWPVIRAVLCFRGVVKPDQELAARFHALGELPQGTLGYEFFQHCQKEGIPFAGETGGLPIGAAFHDFSHVLGGYDTSPEGEMKNAAFQAGFTQDEDDFFVMLFAIVIHSAGVNLTPFKMPVLLGRIGQGSLALEVFHGWQRGAAMNVDLGSDWDFWDEVEAPIDAVRERLGVPPLNLDLAAA